MRTYLALCCIALAAVVVTGEICGGRHHDDKTTCVNEQCNATAHMEMGCQEGVCTCVQGKISCLSSQGDCAALHCEHGRHHPSPHCLDGYCRCLELDGFQN